MTDPNKGTKITLYWYQYPLPSHFPLNTYTKKM